MVKVRAIAIATGMNPSSIRTYLRALEAGGFVRRTNEPHPDGGSRFERVIWALIKDTGVDAPVLNADGAPRRVASGQDQMWRTIKVLGRFTGRDLAVAASTEEHVVSAATALSYCKALRKAGYLHCVHPPKPGTETVYQLLPSMNTGPRAPQIQQTKAVWDPNLERVVWTAVGGPQ